MADTNNENNSTSFSLKDVGYYNKEITKKEQRNNADIIGCTSLSLGLVACAPQVNPESTFPPREEPQGEGSPDPSLLNQAPTSFSDEIKEIDVKRAIVQYYNNKDSGGQEKKLKVTMNCDFGDGEERVEWIASLTNELGNFKKYHPEESRHAIQEWTMQQRKDVIASIGVKPYLGKFHENHGWRAGKPRVNQIEPWTSCLVWYNPAIKQWQAIVKIYEFELAVTLQKETLSAEQIKRNVKGEKLWINPSHYKMERPLTWAQKRKQAKGA